ncbi:MAG: DNA mismatch repair protein MutS [Meiothermus sp.]
MRVFLLHEDRDFDPSPGWPEGEAALERDLELPVIWNAMAGGDPFVYEMARKVMFSSLSSDPQPIHYRQAVLKDALENPEELRRLYALTLEAMELEKKARSWFYGRSPGAILSRSLEVLQLYMGLLRKLRERAKAAAGRFRSPGFCRLFGTLQEELGEAYLRIVEKDLKGLRFPQGVLLGARLGKGLKGAGYTLLRPNPDRRSWLERILGKKPPSYSFQIPPRDEGGARALSELQDRGIDPVARALAQATDHILGFFTLLRSELAFYLGCLNLHEQLSRLGEPTCFPQVSPQVELSFRQLYSLSLALRTEQRVVGNDLEAPEKTLFILTGANQGGKTTFLRSVGQAQLMMQAGMFVGAEAFRANLCCGVFTHFKREEDPTMKSGKFDEELGRMSRIVDRLTPCAMVLFNESFSATNEREGSEIAQQIVRALLEYGVKVFFVTHMYTLASGLYQQSFQGALFLRAQRLSGGQRTYKILPGQPQPSSFGADLYRAVFKEPLPGT